MSLREALRLKRKWQLGYATLEKMSLSGLQKIIFKRQTSDVVLGFPSYVRWELCRTYFIS